VADRLCEEIGKKGPPKNPLVEMEKQMDELRAYQNERDEREYQQHTAQQQRERTAGPQCKA
jgi:hypothetical protein